MRRSNWTPSIVPNADDQNVYMVVDDLGGLGRIWPEADFEGTDLETVIGDLLRGQYNNPIQIISFNVAEGWARDMSEDVAQELRVAIYSSTKFQPAFRTSLNSTNGTTANNSYCGWSDGAAWGTNQS